MGVRFPRSVALKVRESLRDVVESVEIVGRQDLSFNDGKVDFDLVEPARMVWRMNEDGVGALLEKDDLDRLRLRHPERGPSGNLVSRLLRSNR